jgi:hypothetical protein
MTSPVVKEVSENLQAVLGRHPILKMTPTEEELGRRFELALVSLKEAGLVPSYLLGLLGRGKAAYRAYYLVPLILDYNPFGSRIPAYRYVKLQDGLATLMRPSAVYNKDNKPLRALALDLAMWALHQVNPAIIREYAHRGKSDLADRELTMADRDHLRLLTRFVVECLVTSELPDQLAMIAQLPVGAMWNFGQDFGYPNGMASRYFDRLKNGAVIEEALNKRTQTCILADQFPLQDYKDAAVQRYGENLDLAAFGQRIEFVLQQYDITQPISLAPPMNGGRRESYWRPLLSLHQKLPELAERLLTLMVTEAMRREHGHRQYLPFESKALAADLLKEFVPRPMRCPPSYDAYLRKIEALLPDPPSEAEIDQLQGAECAQAAEQTRSLLAQTNKLDELLAQMCQ